MKRFITHLVLLSACLIASVGAAAGSATLQVLDRDMLILPYIEQDNVYRLTLLRSSTGEWVLRDQRDGTPQRETALGFTPPLGSGMGSYTATSDGHAWATFASADSIRVYDLGDLGPSGPLAPTLMHVQPMAAGYDPRTVQTGIIAILIGLVVQPAPAFSVIDGTSNTLTFGLIGSRFERVVKLADGSWAPKVPQ